MLVEFLKNIVEWIIIGVTNINEIFSILPMWWSMEGLWHDDRHFRSIIGDSKTATESQFWVVGSVDDCHPTVDLGLRNEDVSSHDQSDSGMSINRDIFGREFILARW